MKITMNSSCTVTKDVVLSSPINGDVEVLKVKENGMFDSTFAVTKEIEDCAQGPSPSASAGQGCTQYGPNSGKGVIVQVTTAADGGTNASPYELEIISIRGVS